MVGTAQYFPSRGFARFPSFPIRSESVSITSDGKLIALRMSNQKIVASYESQQQLPAAGSNPLWLKAPLEVASCLKVHDATSGGEAKKIRLSIVFRWFRRLFLLW